MSQTLPDSVSHAASSHISSTEWWLFAGFGVLITIFLVLDLGFFNKKPKSITTRAALIQSIFWVSLAMAFCFLIYFTEETPQPAIEFLSAYLTEYALSVDNIFVIILILRYFKVDELYYHSILFWGILGAIIMRAIFIFVGAFIIHHFHPILYVFGVILLYTGFKMMFGGDDDKDIDEQKNPVLRFARRYLPFTNQQEGGKFFVRKAGKLVFTPLFMVILMIEFTDLIFAVDSIPAAFGISQNEFVIYTSNIFAVLGLRAMFFLLSNVLDKFYLLSKGLAFILVFIGGKMLLPALQFIHPVFAQFHVDVVVSLLIIILLLGGSIVLSVIFPKKEEIA